MKLYTSYCSRLNLKIFPTTQCDVVNATLHRDICRKSIRYALKHSTHHIQKGYQV